MYVCMYVCVVLPLTSEGPPLLGRTPPEATRSPSPVSYLLWGWGWDPSLPTLGSDRDNPDTSQTCNQPHQTNLSSGSSSRSLLFDDLELCAARFTTARTSPAHHEVAVLGRTSLPKGVLDPTFRRTPPASPCPSRLLRERFWARKSFFGLDRDQRAM